MNKQILELIYKYLQKALVSERRATVDGYIAEAMNVIEKIIKNNY